MLSKPEGAVIISLILMPLLIWGVSKKTPTPAPIMPTETQQTKTETAIFAGGCFWCMQPPYDDLPGVIDTIVGYTGGHTTNPTYAQITTGKTGHAEAVKIIFDPTKTTYEDLLTIFWKNINPTQINQQFADIGTQYRTAIFPVSEKQKDLAIASKKALNASKKFDQPIATTIEPFDTFYPAEKEHQDFYKTNPLRYNSYKIGSGRAGYIQKTWDN